MNIALPLMLRFYFGYTSGNDTGKGSNNKLHTTIIATTTTTTTTAAAFTG